jgi:hypothetical protein
MPSFAERAAGVSLGAALAGLAALRRGKAFHPKGVVHAATLTITDPPASAPASAVLGRPGEHRAIVRFSRALGLPERWPDLLGMTIRLPDAYGPGAHQDFLLVTSVDAPVLHHAFLPVTRVDQRPYSSSLPYRAGGDPFLVGTLPDGAGRFRLAVAPVMGHFRAIGELTIGERLAPELDALPFSPWNCGGGLTPSGFLNALRRYAYPMSQNAWRRTRHRAR